MKPNRKKSATLGLSAVLLTASLCHADFFQAPFGPGGTWRIYETPRGGQTFKNALAAAQASVDPVIGFYPGNLVSITSLQKNTWLYKTVGQTPGNSWIGLIDREGVAVGSFESQSEPNNRTAGWAWTNGDSYSDIGLWGGGEPNDSGGVEDAAHFRDDMLWNDHRSGFSANDPIAPTIKPGTSGDEVPGSPSLSFMVEYALNSPTPIPGIRHGMVFPICDDLAPGLPINTAGNWSLREVTGLTQANSITRAMDRLVSGDGSIFQAQVPYLDHTDPQTNGAGGAALATAPFPLLSDTAADDDRILAVAKTRINITTAGDYTFQVRSDDGFALRVKGQNWGQINGGAYIDPFDPTALVVERDGEQNTRGVLNLAVGQYDVEFVTWEGVGGAYYEVTSATGVRLIPGEAVQWLPLGSSTVLPDINTLNTVRLTAPATVSNQRIRNNAGGTNVLPAMRYRIDNVVGTTGIKTNLQLGEGDMPNNNGGDEYITKVTGTFTVDPDANVNTTPGELIDVTFRLNCDDGASMRVIGQDFVAINDMNNERRLIDNGGDMTITGDFPTGDTDTRGRIQLTEGTTYDFVCYQYEFGGGSNFNLYWQLGDHVDNSGSFTSLSTTAGPIAITGVPDPVGFPGVIGALVENTNIIDPGPAPFLDDTRIIMAEAIAQSTAVTGTRSIVVLRGDGDICCGRPGNNIFASSVEMPLGLGHDNYLTKVTGQILVDDQDGNPGESLTITFGVFADDGADLHIVGQDFTSAHQGGSLQNNAGDDWLVADFFGGNTNAYGQITLTEGAYTFESHSYEGGGGNGHEVWWANGAFTNFDSAAFKPLTDQAGFFVPGNTGIPLVAGLDLDGDDDGIPTAWEVAHGLNDANPADAALDSDGDGQSNLKEYASDTDPRSGASLFQVSAVEKTPGEWSLTFPARPGRHYYVQATTDLANGPWLTVGELFPPGAPVNQEMALPTAILNAILPGPRAFFRVQAEACP